MRAKVPDALVTMGCPPVNFIMRLLCPHELAVARCVTDGRRGSTLWVRVRSQEGFDGKSPLYVLELYPYTNVHYNHDPVQAQLCTQRVWERVLITFRTEVVDHIRVLRSLF